MINIVNLSMEKQYIENLFKEIQPKPEEIITADLKTLLRQKLKLHPKTRSFIYDWISFGTGDSEFEQSIWEKVCLSQVPKIKLYRAADKLYPGKYTSWTKDIEVAKKFAKNNGENRNIFEYSPGKEVIRYYPLCDVSDNIINQGTLAEDEYLDKAKFEQEYIVLEQSSTSFSIYCDF